jgi:hypothetical protein
MTWSREPFRTILSALSVYFRAVFSPSPSSAPFRFAPLLCSGSHVCHPSTSAVPVALHAPFVFTDGRPDLGSPVISVA